jgi:hypothetical protein
MYVECTSLCITYTIQPTSAVIDYLYFLQEIFRFVDINNITILTLVARCTPFHDYLLPMHLWSLVFGLCLSYSILVDLPQICWLPCPSISHSLFFVLLILNLLSIHFHLPKNRMHRSIKNIHLPLYRLIASTSLLLFIVVDLLLIGLEFLIYK